MYCRYCGREIPDSSRFCPSCGRGVEDSGAYQYYYDQPTQRKANIKEEGNIGWAFLGFFFPLVGLILCLVWKDDHPGDAKMAGKGALICVGTVIGLWLLSFLLMFMIIIFGFGMAI